jgi:biotin transport system substrate-specific component
MTTITLSHPPRRVLGDVLSESLLGDAILIVGAAALVGLLAQVSIPLGFTPVPITGQTLGVLLAGTALGWRRAGLSMALYVAAGVAGVPWFAQHSHGLPTATFGYLLGFVLAGSLLGWLAAHGRDRTVLRALTSMLLGEAAIYAVALPWLAVSLHVSLAHALTLGFTPFVVGDLIKAALAGLALPVSWRLVDRLGHANS